MYVCLARSSRLAKKGAYLIVLSKGDSVLFEGCLELQVLAGLLHIHGYTVTPSHTPLPLFSPSHSSYLPLKAIDPHSVRDKCLQPLVHSLREPVVKFVASGLPLEGCGLITVDLELDDISWLNSLNRVAISCVCVVWNLDSPLVSGLQTVPRCGLLKVAPSGGQSASSTTFRLINMSDRHSVTTRLCMPPAYNMMLMDIIDYKGAVVLVCGDVNTGKSTVCRFLINTFLNRYEKVGYLECDVGQPEFTVSAVISLHVLTDPVFGPTYSDPRKPYKAFYYGHPEPSDKPRYYVRLIEQLYSVFMTDIHGNGEVPLVINTCGWVTDLGVPLMMDVIRLTSPTHIVRLVTDNPQRTIHPLTDLLPFTPHTLTSTPGILTHPSHLPHSVEEEWYSTNIHSVRAPRGVPASSEISLSHKVSQRSQTLNQAVATLDHKETTLSSDPQPTQGDDGSSSDREEEVICVDSEDSCEPESDVEIIGYQPPPLHAPLHTHTPSQSHNIDGMEGEERKRRNHKRTRVEGDIETRSKVESGGSKKAGRRKRAADTKIVKERRKRRGLRKIPFPGQQVNWMLQTMNTATSSEHWQKVESCMVGKWSEVLDYRVGVLRAAPGVRGKDSKLMRRLALVAHFSLLISGCGDHAYFLDNAPVLQVPWSNIAIHVLPKEVPRSDMLYAMRGNYVALGRVDPSEVVERQLDGGGRVRFLHSHTPTIEFLAMGVFCGTAPNKELYYVTTPLFVDDPVAMETVNVLVMGEVQSLFGFSALMNLVNSSGLKVKLMFDRLQSQLKSADEKTLFMSGVKGDLIYRGGRREEIRTDLLTNK